MIALSLVHKIVGGAALVAILSLFVLYKIADRRADKFERQAISLSAEIKRANDRADQAEADATRLTKLLKDAKDEQDRRIADDARSLLLRGPGKARCPATVPQGAAGAPGTNPDAPGPQLPSGDRAAVPWDWLVNRAKGHDELLNYLLKDLEWHRQMEESWGR